MKCLGFSLGALAFVGVGALAAPALAREYETEIIVDSPEELYDMLGSGELDEETVDFLVALMDHPLDLNRADARLLYDLPSVTYELAEAIVAARAARGPFSAVEELLQVPGMTQLVFESILPFITVRPPLEDGATAPVPVEGDGRLGMLYRDGLKRGAKGGGKLDELVYGPQSYLKAQAAGFTYFGAGLLATFRARTSADWDLSQGRLVSEGPQEQPDLDGIYLRWGYGAWGIIVGSYDIGFGERLTLDTTSRRDPHGFEENVRFSEDNETGRLRPDAGLFGVAASMEGADLPFGWMDVSLFASTERNDEQHLYFGLDPLNPGSATCTFGGSPTGCPSGYECGEDGLCHTSTMYDPEGDTFGEDLSLKDAYRETLFGGNATLNLDDDTSIGVTAYRAQTEILIADESEPFFAPASKWPQRLSFGAAGLNARTAVGPVTFSGEVARSFPGSFGVYTRAIVDLESWGETSLAVRRYDAAFENPHSRGESARDEVMGLAGRNEEGVRWELVLLPVKGLRVSSDIDVWRNPEVGHYDADGDLTWREREQRPLDLFIRERVAWTITSKETVAVVGTHTNKNVNQNSGCDGSGALKVCEYENYEDGDRVLDTDSDNEVGRGESYRLQFSGWTTRLPKVRVSASTAMVWESHRPPADERAAAAIEGNFLPLYDFSTQYRLRVSAKPWDGGLLVGAIGYWTHNVPRDPEDEDPFSDRDKPALDTYLDLKQRLGDFILKARYGLQHYRDENPDRFAWYHLAKVSVEMRF